MSRRLPAPDLDRLLISYIRGAESGDAYQARMVHEVLNWMLTEREVAAGKWWLTDFGNSVLADMHGRLSACPEHGEGLPAAVLKITMLTPTKGDRRNLGKVLRHSAIASSVQEELNKQPRRSGKRPNVTAAAKRIAKSRKYDLEWGTIRNIYYRWRTYFQGNPEGFLPDTLLQQLQDEKDK